MCGIFGIVNVPAGKYKSRQLRQQALRASRRQQHRGPDWSGVAELAGSLLLHNRLAIVDPESGDQPFTYKPAAAAAGRITCEWEGWTCAANGEIYNHEALRAKLAPTSFPFKTKSDCEVLIPMFLEHGPEFVKELDGQFAFLIAGAQLHDSSFLAARDPVGINPLYWGHTEDGALAFSSEMKCLETFCVQFQVFPPGHYLTKELYESGTGPVKFADVPSTWAVRLAKDESAGATTLNNSADIRPKLKEALVRAVEKRLMSDVPWGVLLSGGLDSSLIAALAVRAVNESNESGGTHLGGTGAMKKVHTFSIGLVGSPDLAAARKVADFLGTEHHEYTFTVKDGLDAVDQVVYHLETYDVTTVRASTPMFLMARKIKSLGIKMVFSGEGADEIFAGYLYFHKAPTAHELHKELVRKTQQLHLFDCLRANKALAAWGVEGRFPFLDRDVLDLAFQLDATEKMSSTHPAGPRIEKHWLRDLFAEDKLLPEDVLWRQKEQFSDGVGTDWIDQLKERADASVCSSQMTQACYKYPFQTPRTKEAYFVRQIFVGHFPSRSAEETVLYTPSIACSTADIMHWDAEFAKMAKESNGEQSGRAVKDVHWTGQKPAEEQTAEKTREKKEKAEEGADAE